jgi:hypothetical protein
LSTPVFRFLLFPQKHVAVFVHFSTLPCLREFGIIKPIGGDFMPVSANKRKTNDAYNAKCDRIVIQPKKETGEEIRAAAKAAGKSLQGYILDAIRIQMAADAEQGTGEK